MKILLTIVTILTSFFTNLETHTLQSDFSVIVVEDVDEMVNYSGSVTMQGNRFHINFMGYEAAYDGETMYVYSDDTDELTLLNPTEQELQEVNPFLFAKALLDVCNITERTVSDGRFTIVTLTPKDQSVGIKRFTLKIRNSDLTPVQADMKEGGKITTLKFGESRLEELDLPASTYTLRAKENTYINDMRQ